MTLCHFCFDQTTYSAWQKSGIYLGHGVSAGFPLQQCGNFESFVIAYQPTAYRRQLRQNQVAVLENNRLNIKALN
jgi:hypothetical protein